MLEKLRNMKSAKIRLALSICLCLVFFAASPTSPSDDEGCGSSSTTSEGYIVVQNNSIFSQTVNISGPSNTSYNLNSGYQMTSRVSTGSYSVSASVYDPGSAYHGQSSYGRSFHVSEGETETCRITVP